MTRALEWELGRIVYETMIKTDIQYHLMQDTTNNALDLSGADNRSILVFPFHGGVNQQVNQALELSTLVTKPSVVVDFLPEWRSLDHSKPKNQSAFDHRWRSSGGRECGWFML